MAAILNGPLLRLASVGLVVLALQRTVFADMRPAGVSIQVMLALAAACGAAGGPQKGALAGFVLGLMYDLSVGTPLGSSSLAMGIGGFVAGYVTSITVERHWWLAALFTALGAAVGEAMVPVIRAFVGEEQVFEPRLGIVVGIVAAGALVLSPLLVPVGRWCMRIKRPEWKAPKEA